MIHFRAEQDAPRLDVWLARELADGYSRARIQQWIRGGAVCVNGQTVRTCRASVPAGAQITILPPKAVPSDAPPAAEAIALAVLYEDQDLIVVNKPPGMVVHPAPGHSGGTLVNALLHHCRDLGGINGILRPGIVHRLDRDTSGLMVAAKTDAAMTGLMNAFKSGAVGKIYLSLVHGLPAPPSATIESAIGRHPVHRKKMAVVTRGGRRAITHYRVRQALHRSAWLEVRIETGRTHQIRVHLATAGFPLLGDPLYGSASRDRSLEIPIPRVMLHAWQLSFPHPVNGDSMVFEQPPPDDFESVRHALG